MATLVLKEFRCVEDTSESFEDSPYWVVYEGDPSRPGAEAGVTVVRREAWDNEIEAGSFRAPNAVIAKDVDTNHLVLCALMEEDHDPDIVGIVGLHVRNWMAGVFDAYRAGGSTSAKQLAVKLKPELCRALAHYRSNDEILGIKHIPVTTTDGLLPLRSFCGDGGHYRVRFETKD